MSGFFAGAKPSRNGRPPAGSANHPAPGQLIDIAKPQIERHPPAVEQQTMAPAEGRRPLRLQLLRPRSQLWPALVRRRRSSAFSGYFSKLMKCNLCKVTSGLSRTKTSNACQRVRKLSPVPKPLSATIISGRGWLGKRSGRRFPPRKRSESLPDRCHWKSKHRRNLGKQVYPQR